MRLALVIPSLSAGGAERVMSGMASHWATKGWDLTLITTADDQPQDFYALHPAVKRVRLAKAGNTSGWWEKLSRNARSVLRLRRALQHCQPDLVIAFLDVTNVLTLLASRWLGVRVIVSERIDPSVNPEIKPAWRWLRRWTYPFATAVVAQTEAASAWLREHCGCTAVTIPNPLRGLPDPALQRKPIVLSVGRLVHQKGFDVLLDAFAQVAEQNPGWQLVMLGEGPDRPALEARVRRLGLSDRVDMPGVVRDPEIWMAQAGVVVQASRYEGFPNVVMESMAMGAAVISTDCRSGPADLIRGDVNGLLVPVNDVPALAHALNDLLSQPDKRLRLGHSALTVRQSHAEDAIMSRWEALILDRGAATTTI